MKTGKIVYLFFSWTLVLVVLGFIFNLSAQNAEDSKELSDSIVSKILQWIEVYIDGELLRKIAHMLEFTALSFSLYNAIFVTCELKKLHLISLILTVMCAIGDEIHQIFVPGRAFQLSDILIDSTGAIIGIVAYLIMYKIYLIIKERGNKNGSIKTI
jgi:VanZ family protein